MKKWLFPLCVALLLGVTACGPGAVSEESPPPVSRPADTAAPTPVPAGGVSVHTDWSKLGEKAAPLPEIGGRWYEEYTDTLLPRDDYGMLIPYAGLRLLDDWPSANGCLWGLMTADGVAVTEAVFSNVYRASYYSDYGSGNYGYIPHPLLVLSKGDATLDENQWDPAKIAIAAADGSWCTDFDYRCVRSHQNGLLLYLNDGLAFMDPNGVILHRYSAAEMGLTEREFASLLSGAQFGDGVGGRWEGDYLTIDWADDTTQAVQLFHVSTGERSVLSYDEWQAYSAEQAAPQQGGGAQEERAAILERVLADLPPEESGQGEWLQDGLLGDDAAGLLRVTTHSGDDAKITYYTADGTRISQLDNWSDPFGRAWYRRVDLKGGLIEMLDLNTASYYDINTMECVFRRYLGYDTE